MRRFLQGVGKYRWGLALACAVCALDQLSKFWVVSHLPENAYYNDGAALCLIPEWLYIVRVNNVGAAWGMFSGYAMALALLGIFALALVFAFRRHLELERTGIQAIFGLLCGGIAGNLIDRFTLGYVVDFILVILPGGYHWPSFNVADMAITIAVLCYLALSLFEKPKEKRA